MGQGGPAPAHLQYNVPQQQQMGQGGPAGPRVYVGGTSHAAEEMLRARALQEAEDARFARALQAEDAAAAEGAAFYGIRAAAAAEEAPRPSGLMGPNPGAPLSSENLPSVGSEPDALAQTQSSFYQSALRSAERESAQLQAQRHALDQADRAVALLVQQAPPTVMRPSPATAANG
jgi:hypothetical protein